MNIILKEFRMNLKAYLFWILGLGFFALASFMKIGTMRNDPASLYTVVNFMPRMFKVLFGLGNPDIISPAGILGMVMYYMLVLGVVYASMLGASIILREEKDKTTEFLLVKPIAKSGIFCRKATAGAIMLFGLTVFVSLFSYGSLRFFMETTEYTGLVLRYGIALFIVLLFFFGTGLFIASIVKKLKLGTNLSLLIFGISFAMMLVSKLTESVGFLDRFNPFSLYLNSDFNDDKLLLLKGAVLLLIFAGLVFAGSRLYERKDIYV